MGVETGRRARGCGPGCPASGGTPGPLPPAPRGLNAPPGDTGLRRSPAADREAEPARRSPGHAPLPAFPEPPVAAPGPLSASSLGCSASRRGRLRPLESPPRPHLPPPSGPGPSLRARRASVRGRHRQRSRGRPGQPHGAGAGSGPRARREPLARPSCGPPPAARTPRPPPRTRLPPVGLAPPSSPAPGRREKGPRPDPGARTLRGASLGAGGLSRP